MRQLSLFFIAAMFLIGSLFSASCSITGVAEKFAPQTVLSATTPGDAEVKKMLGIPSETPVDMIRWELTLTEEKTFLLGAVYGEAKPNTRGMIVENKLSFNGSYEITRGAAGDKIKEIYRLKSELPAARISLVKVNDNLFHLLTAEDKLMIGNGGWSYTLNRKEPSADVSSLPVPSISNNEPALQTIFDGRTPCAEISQQFAIPVPEDCFKLKWRVTFNRDPKTFAPTTYTIQRIDHRPNLITGKWTIEKGTGANAGAVIYKLDPAEPQKSLSFAAGDENVLFFLDKNGRLLVGDGEFSYTLNRHFPVKSGG